MLFLTTPKGWRRSFALGRQVSAAAGTDRSTSASTCDRRALVRLDGSRSSRTSRRALRYVYMVLSNWNTSSRAGEPLGHLNRAEYPVGSEGSTLVEAATLDAARYSPDSQGTGTYTLVHLTRATLSAPPAKTLRAAVSLESHRSPFLPGRHTRLDPKDDSSCRQLLRSRVALRA